MRKVASFTPLALLFLAAPAFAQFDHDPQSVPREPRVFLGANLIVAEPQQDFADYVDTSLGGSLNVVWKPAARSIAALRIEGGVIGYGHETQRVPFSATVGGRVMVDVTTNNFIVFAHAGPQLMAPKGLLRPYVAPSVGFAYIATVSSVKGDDSSESFASDTNYDDVVFSYGATGGVYVPITSGRVPIALDLGVRYHRNGVASYLTEGSITDHNDGTISYDPIHSSTDMLTFQLGISIGIARGR